MKTKDELIDKVKKLLNLADSSRNNSDEEAKSALLRAQQLMTKYDLSIEEVSEESGPEYSQEICENKWNYAYRVPLAAILADNFRCKFYSHGKSIAFMGHPSDARLAKETFEFAYKYIMRQGNALYNKRYQMGQPTKGVFNSYAKGFLAGLKSAFDRQCVALQIVTPPDVVDHFEEMTRNWKVSHTKMRQDRLDADSYLQGERDGKSFMDTRKLDK